MARNDALAPEVACLIRAIIAKSAAARDRVLLHEVKSADWKSLTFIGSRHDIALSVPAANAPNLRNLGNVEFDIPGHIVADITLRGEDAAPNDRVLMRFEALTIADNLLAKAPSDTPKEDK